MMVSGGAEESKEFFGAKRTTSPCLVLVMPPRKADRHHLRLTATAQPFAAVTISGSICPFVSAASAFTMLSQQSKPMKGTLESGKIRLVESKKNSERKKRK
jgi:hypothetical protein